MNPNPLSVFFLIVPCGILLTSQKKFLRRSPTFGVVHRSAGFYQLACLQQTAVRLLPAGPGVRHSITSAKSEMPTTPSLPHEARAGDCN